MPGSSGSISSAVAKGTKSSGAVSSAATISASSISPAEAISLDCDGTVACASSGWLDCDETSFLGNGEDCPLEGPMVVHRKTSDSAAAAPTAAHPNILREAT